MKKLMIMLCAACLLFVAVPAFSVLAAENEGEPTNVNITVVMPEIVMPPTEEPAPSPPAEIKVFPSNVEEIRENGGWQIIRTYELQADESPQDIPRESFTRSGWEFNLTDIIRRETANAETQEHTETVTLETDSNVLEQIMPLLSQTIEYRNEDGFVGVLSLNVSSIKVETAGTRTTSHTMTVTREYPRLSSNDTSHVPKTVTDRGTTYHLAGVDWKVGNYSTVDYVEIADYYTAVATYTATGTSTRVTGYITTAEYTGTLARLSQGKTTYIAFFLGEEIRTPLEMVTPTPEPTPESTPEPTPVEEPTDEEPEDCPDEVITETPDDEIEGKNNLMWLAIIPCLVVLVGGAYYFLRRKGKPHNEETRNANPVADDDGGDGSSGSGG